MAATPGSTSAPSPGSCEAAELPDGRYALATVGMRRVHVTRWLADDPFPRRPRSSSSTNRAPDDDADHTPARVDALATARELHRRIDPRLPDLPAFDADPAQASYEAAALRPSARSTRSAARGADAADARLLADLLDDDARMLRAGGLRGLATRAGVDTLRA